MTTMLQLLLVIVLVLFLLFVIIYAARILRSSHVEQAARAWVAKLTRKRSFRVGSGFDYARGLGIFPDKRGPNIEIPIH